MDRRAWWARVHRVSKSQTRLKQLSTHAQNVQDDLSLRVLIASAKTFFFQMRSQPWFWWLKCRRTFWDFIIQLTRPCEGGLSHRGWKKLHACMLVTQSCPTLCHAIACKPTRPLCPWGFSRQEYWSELPFPPPGDLTDAGIEPESRVSCTGRQVL